jgi:hypothetical protein
MEARPETIRQRGTNVRNWDAKPIILIYKGQDCEFFYRSHLAKALDRQIVSIRALEQRNVFCHPKFKDNRQRWLYTRDQIEDLIALFKEEGVLDPRQHRPYSARFIKEAHAILSRLPGTKMENLKGASHA